ncbi:hypothetical protein MesoLj113b_64140 [Mesorhizobium sp. 113-3-3]|nr:hypothetical protein MesoLj113b_64140 [Mesorhizobium sp. 113-3-3]BCG90749.1 hypothetical protein MesoLj113c_68590 [Mesorhizobium sp. 113-3-9]
MSMIRICDRRAEQTGTNPHVVAILIPAWPDDHGGGIAIEEIVARSGAYTVPRLPLKMRI